MSALAFKLREPCDRLGLKGPRAADWLAANGIAPPAKANTWTRAVGTSPGGELLVARLGSSEFFLEVGPGGTLLQRLAPSLEEPPPGIYPVMREDRAFDLSGDGVHDVLAQVCNVDFAALPLDSRPLIMTLMIGVAVLVVPQGGSGSGSGSGSGDGGGGGGGGGGGDSASGDAAGRHYGIWCDPTFGAYLGASLGAVVVECGGRYTGVCG